MAGVDEGIRATDGGCAGPSDEGVVEGKGSHNRRWLPRTMATGSWPGIRETDGGWPGRVAEACARTGIRTPDGG